MFFRSEVNDVVMKFKIITNFTYGLPSKQKLNQLSKQLKKKLLTRLFRCPRYQHPLPHLLGSLSPPGPDYRLQS